MDNNVTYMFGNPDELAFEVDDTVNIPRNEYENLLEDSHWLRSLEAAGVNSWDGYDEALRLFDEENEVVDEGDTNGN
jgi:hypothetical protein